MMKKAITFYLFLILNIQAVAQRQINGIITSQKTQEPVMAADIVVLDPIDSSIIIGTFSDEFGKFSFAIPDSLQDYYIKIEALGFQKLSLALPIDSFFNIQMIPLNLEQLDNVTVVGTKKAISINGDKIIYDIDQMGIGTGNNGLETMQQLPGVRLDKDDNIVFRGSAGVQIMINGKKSMLEGDALREFIRSLKGEDIQSVEIIAQPSARYDASGTTGILNIVLKKNTYKTFGGNVYTYGGYGDYYKFQIGSSIFYNDEKWSINARASIYNGQSFNDRSVNQSIIEGDDHRVLNQNNYWLPTTSSQNLNLGIERRINKNSLISTEWQWYNEDESANTRGRTLDYLNNELQNNVTLIKENKSPTDQISGNLFYNYTSDSMTTKVDMQANYAYYEQSIDGFQENKYASGSFDRIDGRNHTIYNLMNIQLDVTQRIYKSLTLEAGAKFSYVGMRYYNQYASAPGSKLLLPDSLLINDFDYTEYISAAYTQLHYNLKNWNFLVGTRIERYKYSAESHNNYKTNEGDLTNLFPSASVSYQKDDHQFRISYSKRISRPGYLMLNPYFEYLDAYSIERGNPDLKPQIFHSLELNYVFKNALSFALYGYLYKNGFVQVIDYQKNDNYNILYNSNASNGSRIGLSASIPYSIEPWWTMQYSIDAYLESEHSDINRYTYDGRGYGIEFNTYQKFTLPNSWSITLNGFLNSRSKTPTGYLPMIYDFSTSIKKSFFDEKIQVIAGCSNILKKNMWNSTSTVQDVTTQWINKWETRRFYIQFTYRFGGNQKKEIKNTSLQDEQGRM